MARTKPKGATASGEAAAAAEPASFGAMWATVAPGARMGRGTYSVYKTTEGGLLVSYRPEGELADCHLPIPPALVATMIAASEGKGPLGRMRALVGGLG